MDDAGCRFADSEALMLVEGDGSINEVGLVVFYRLSRLPLACLLGQNFAVRVISFYVVPTLPFRPFVGSLDSNETPLLPGGALKVGPTLM